MATTFSKQTKFFRLLRYFHALFGGLMWLMLLVLLLNSYVLTIFRVDGISMEPTFSNGQLVPVILNIYRITSPKVGDLVIFKHEGDANVRYVKRVTAVPGDKVILNSGVELILAPGQYFVTGDNRDHSTDSRVFGPVGRDQLIGRVLNSVPPPEK